MAWEDRNNTLHISAVEVQGIHTAVTVKNKPLK